MVSLKNFIKNDKTLECDFYPDNKDENKCHIIIDKDTEEIVSVSVPETVECYNMDIGGARTVLARYIDKDSFPDIDYYICG